MTPLQRQNNAVWDALQEGKVEAVIALVGSGYIEVDKTKPHRHQLFAVLTSKEYGVGMEEAEADYWLDWYGVK